MIEKKIAEALKSDSDFELKTNFADQVLLLIEKKEEEKASLRHLIILYCAVFGFVLLSVISLLFLTTPTQLHLILAASKWALLIGVLVACIQIMDALVLLKRKQKRVI